jgi:hypothetical protein
MWRAHCMCAICIELGCVHCRQQTQTPNQKFFYRVRGKTLHRGPRSLQPWERGGEISAKTARNFACVPARRNDSGSHPRLDDRHLQRVALPYTNQDLRRKITAQRSFKTMRTTKRCDLKDHRKRGHGTAVARLLGTILTRAWYRLVHPPRRWGDRESRRF